MSEPESSKVAGRPHRPREEDLPFMVSHRTLRELDQGRANNFDALRVLLALMVIFSHSYPLLLGSNDFEPFFRATGGQRTAGELAVDGFFLISGYLITSSWLRSRGLLDYLKRRALRIYPGFLVAVAFSSFVAGPLLSDDRAGFWREFDYKLFAITALKLDGAYYPGTTTNGSLWSIRYEFFCYLGLAAFGLMGILRRRLLVLLFTLFCTYLFARILLTGMEMPGSRLTWLWGFPGFWPRLAACYFAGSAFYLYADRIPHSGRLALLALAGLLAAGLVPGSQILPLLVPYLVGYLIFYLAFVPAGNLKDFARRGDLSYGLYLYAFPIQLLLVRWFRPHLTAPLVFLAASLATAILAALSWHFVESPCMKLKKSKPRPEPGPKLSPGELSPVPIPVETR